MVENAVYVWTGGVNGEKNLRFRKYPDTCGLLVELYCGIVIKHVAFFAVCATLRMAVTLASLLLNFCSSVSEFGCGFRFEQKYCGSTDLANGGTDLHTPIHSPLHWIKFI